MKREIIREFLGKIGDVEFDSKDHYYATSFILDQVEDMELYYNTDVVRRLRDAIWDIDYKTEDYSQAELERELYSSLQNDYIFDGGVYGTKRLFHPNLALEKANRGNLHHARIVESLKNVYDEEDLKKEGVL